MRPMTGALPTAIASRTRLDNRRNLSPPHFSAIHFSAIPSFASFCSFRLSPRNHLAFVRLAAKNEIIRKNGIAVFLLSCGPDLDRPGTAPPPARLLVQRAARRPAISHRPIFLPSIFLPFTLSPLSALSGYHQKSLVGSFG